MTNVVEKEPSLLSNLAGNGDLAEVNGDGWTSSLRRAAASRFVELGLPTQEDEDWRHTNVAPLSKIPFRSSRQMETDGKTTDQATRLIPSFAFGGMDCVRLIFVNGRFNVAFSNLEGLPNGVRVMSLAEAIKREKSLLESHLARHAAFDRHSFLALNTALMEDGAFIRVPKNVAIEKPIHLLFVTVGGEEVPAVHPRNLILAEDGSSAKIIESFTGAENIPYFTNTVTELVAGANSKVEHVKFQQEGRGASHFATLQIYLGANARFASTLVSLGGALVRNELNAALDGEGIESVLNGLYIGTDHQHVDNRTRIIHAKPNCASREVYKGILDQQAVGIFNGRILVKPDAQKTDAKQSNSNLLLSDTATANTEPQLEIFANDVKCTHGATVGQLSEEALFYLRSRGIAPSQARSLLTYAFANEIVAGISMAGVRGRLERLIHERFE